MQNVTAHGLNTGPWPDLDRCDHLLAEHLAEAVTRFGHVALGLVDLPPLDIDMDAGAGALVPAQLRVAAVMLWARHVEEAGLPGFVEALAESVASGRSRLAIGPGADALMAYARGRDERFSAAERQAFYERIFAPPFEAEFLALVGTLGELGRASPHASSEHLQARVNASARRLGALLSARSTGMTAYAARDIVAHVRTALALLGHPDMAAALAARSPWQAVRMHAPLMLGRAPDVTGHISLARAGRDIVAWLADDARRLDAGTARLDRDHPAVRAALTWQAEGVRAAA